MASKKKKRQKGLKRKADKRLQNASLPQLLNQGQAYIESGKAREAIAVLKEALKKGGSAEDVHPLLFSAYLAREAQLRQKGLLAEAGAIRRQVQAYQPPDDRLSEPQLLALLENAEPGEAFAVYGRYRLKQARCQAAEHFLAGSLLIHRRFDLARQAAAAFPFEDDLHTLEAVIPQMDEGAWESAAAGLNTISRGSPFASVRLFCMAMASFLRQDNKGMQRALSMLPNTFPLKPFAARMQSDASRLACLWQGRAGIEKDLLAICDLLKREMPQKAARLLLESAGRILPDAPETARHHLLELLWRLVQQGIIYEEDFKDMASGVLTQTEAGQFSAKTAFHEFEDPFEDTGAYLKQVPAEFPDPEEQRIARGLILLNAVKKIRAADLYPEEFGLPVYADELEISDSDARHYLIDMTLNAIQSDPRNRAAYELLAGLPRTTRTAKRRVEKGLRQMCDLFPADPYPCLELADLYYGQNAFRKAETILAEARKRAPHDSRVLNRYTVSMLIAAGRNIKRGNLDSARHDLDRAGGLAGPATRLAVIEKQVLFAIQELGQMALFGDKPVADPKKIGTVLEQATAGLPPQEALRLLGLILIDSVSVTDADGQGQNNKITKAAEQVLRRKAKDVADMPSADIATLLRPLDPLLRPLFPGPPPAALLVPRIPRILERIDNDDIIGVLDILAEARLFKPACKEIARRLQSAPKALKRLLEFYQLTLIDLETGLLPHPAPYLKIIERLKGAALEPLRAAARRLAAFADEPLSTALRSFEFERHLSPLNHPFFGAEMDEEIFEDDDFEPDLDDLDPMQALRVLQRMSEDMDPEELEQFKGPMDEFVTEFEDFIKKMGLYGEPNRFIKKACKMMCRRRPESMAPFVVFANLLDEKRKRRLSREARAFLEALEQ